MGNYIQASDVRYASGAPVSLISNAAIDHAIDIVEEQTERVMNTKFTPTMRIDILDGTGTDICFTDKNPLLKVDKIVSDDEDIDITSIYTSKSSGMIRLGEDNDENTFVKKKNSLRIKYYFGLLKEEDNTRTETTADVDSGSSVEITVSDASNLSVDDWVEIYGTDGNREIAQITTIVGSVITVDTLNLSHEAESLLVKLTIPEYIKRFMELEAAIYIAINAMGSTYTFNAGYSLGDFSVTKGVPYTHWRESFQSCLKERESIRGIIKQRFKITI